MAEFWHASGRANWNRLTIWSASFVAPYLESLSPNVLERGGNQAWVKPMAEVIMPLHTKASGQAQRNLLLWK